jgi:hypothetical protein
MKTASMLFGLVMTTAGIAHASPRTDANGDVACGNVMTKNASAGCTVRTAAQTLPSKSSRVHTRHATKPPATATAPAVAPPAHDPVLAAFHAPPAKSPR